MAAKELKVVCGCGTQDQDRKAVAVDPETKASNLVRLRRIEGQIRGLQKMVEEDRYCADILVQVSAVHEALRGVSKSLMLNHLKHCTTEALRSGDAARSEEVYEELMALFFKHSR